MFTGVTQIVEDRLLADFSDLAVLIFRTPMADIQWRNIKSAQGPRGGDIHLLKYFTLLFYSNGNSVI